MASVFVIKRTDQYNNDPTETTPIPPITIAPGALNGPGSAQSDSDARLYGVRELMKILFVY